MEIKHLGTILTIFGYFNSVSCQFEMDKYYNMPPLHQHDHDDFERCLWSTKETSTFCTTTTLIKPDKSNAVWNQIEEFSSKRKIHFAHDVVFNGQCIQFCEKRLNKLSEEEREALYVEAFPTNRTFSYDITNFKNGSLYRAMYDKIINQCENIWLRENWNLSGYSTVLWCTTNKEFDHYETDYLHTSFMVITFVILGIVIAGTGLDIQQNNQNSLNYYKVDRSDLPNSQQYLLCFSVVRNWYRLTAQPKTELGRDLRFFLTARYLTTLLVVLGHMTVAHSFMPIINPEFVEQSYYNLDQIIINCGTTIVQTFFTASGVLLYLSLNEILKEGQFNLKYLGAAFTYRIIRLTPPYAYILLFHSTYLFRWGYGPYWKYNTETEYTYCRKNWWTNILYINNYVNTSQQCMFEAWYLAADTHLFIFALFLFMFMWKYPKYKNWVVGVAFCISCTIQFLVTYLNGFNGLFLFPPESKRFFKQTELREFEKDYIASHTNAGNFLIGICLAMTYIHFKKNKIDLSIYKSFVIFWYFIPVLVVFIIIGTGYLFYHNTFEVPSVWISMVSVLTRNTWGLFGSPLVLGFISSLRSPIKNFFHWPVFTPLSRLTYGIYLVHITVAWFMFGQEIRNVHLSWWLFLVQIVSLFVLSNVAALVLGLCIEFPLTGLSKALIRGKRAAFEEQSKRDQDESHIEEKELESLNMQVTDRFQSPNLSNHTCKTDPLGKVCGEKPLPLNSYPPNKYHLSHQK